MRAAAHVYLLPGPRLLCVASARLPAGLWREVTPVHEPAAEAGALAEALERALACSEELSGAARPPIWDGRGTRERARLLARVEREDGEVVLVEQERVEDDYGISWQDGYEESQDSVAEAAARVIELAT